MFKNLIDCVISDFMLEVGDKVFINHDELVKRYVYIPDRFCQYTGCKKVLKGIQEGLCKKHYMVAKIAEVNKDKNKEIDDWKLSLLEDNLYRDNFGMVYRVEKDGHAEYYGHYEDEKLIIEV